MIRADFSANADGALLGFSVLGHSGLAQEGEDILCAAVSSAAYMTANTVLEILHITPISLRAEDGEMLFRVSVPMHGHAVACLRDLSCIFSV